MLSIYNVWEFCFMVLVETVLQRGFLLFKKRHRYVKMVSTIFHYFSSHKIELYLTSCFLEALVDKSLLFLPEQNLNSFRICSNDN